MLLSNPPFLPVPARMHVGLANGLAEKRKIGGYI
jgi:hypothetical protein